MVGAIYGGEQSTPLGSDQIFEKPKAKKDAGDTLQRRFSRLD